MQLLQRAHLLCASQVNHGVQGVQPILASGTLRQASDMQERETRDCLIGMEQGTLLQTHLRSALVLVMT